MAFQKIYDSTYVLSELRRYVDIRRGEYGDPSLDHLENIIEYLDKIMIEYDQRIVENSQQTGGVKGGSGSETS